DWNNEFLRSQILDLGIAERIHLLGERYDMPRLTAALDIACSSSSCGEGFPNVIGEAMSCGVPCVVTDISESPAIVGNSGRIVAPKDPEGLARAWKDLVDLGPTLRSELGMRARSRVIHCFSITSVVQQYESLYESVVAEQRNHEERETIL